MTKLFDKIVGKGKEYALNFIRLNWSNYNITPWVDDEVNDQELSSHETNEHLEQS